MKDTDHWLFMINKYRLKKSVLFFSFRWALDEKSRINQ